MPGRFRRGAKGPWLKAPTLEIGVNPYVTSSYSGLTRVIHAVTLAAECNGAEFCNRCEALA